MKKLIAGAMLLLAGASAHAQIVANGSVGGFGTFVDETTGRTWLRLDNFFDKSADQMVAAASGSGFQLATSSDVADLLSRLTPITPQGWTDDATIMGSAPNRDIIFGAYAGSGGMVGWAYGAHWDSNWNMLADFDFSWDVPNGGSDYADMNLWAFMEGSREVSPGNPLAAVPEPVSWAFMITGFGLVGASMRRRRMIVRFG